MSQSIDQPMVCQQCEETTLVTSASREDQRTGLEQRGWRPYGEGITPFAEENATAGRFACPRCANEFVEQRLNRIANDVMATFDATLRWSVHRSADSDTDFLHIRRDDKTFRVPFGHHQKDRELREELTHRVATVLEDPAATLGGGGS